MSRIILVVTALVASACGSRPSVKRVVSAEQACPSACKVELRACQAEMSPAEEEFFCATELEGCMAKCPIVR